MKNLVSAIMIPAVCLTLAADSTGRISSKVVDSSGKPVAGAKVLLEHTEITWTKEIITGADGKVAQVGLAPKVFNITITATGFTTIKVQRKIPLADALAETFVMLTPEEAIAEAIKKGGKGVDPNAAKEAEGSNSYNAGVDLFNNQKYAEALPHIEKAFKAMTEAAAGTKDAAAKKELEDKLVGMERTYAVVLFETGKGDPAKADLMLKSEPFLTHVFERNAKDQRAVTSLLEIAKVKKDADLTKKFQAALDAIVGPRPELAYNDAVGQFNDGKFTEAKESVTKAIATDPKFAESYWLLGVVEFSLGHNGAAKTAFKKYMELAPTGKKAGEVKEFLKELK